MFENTEDLDTVKKIGINVGALILVMLLLIAASVLIG